MRRGLTVERLGHGSFGFLVVVVEEMTSGLLMVEHDLVFCSCSCDDDG